MGMIKTAQHWGGPDRAQRGGHVGDRAQRGGHVGARVLARQHRGVQRSAVRGSAHVSCLYVPALAPLTLAVTVPWGRWVSVQKASGEVLLRRAGQGERSPTPTQ